MVWEVVELDAGSGPLQWLELPGALRAELSGKLSGLWGASTDQQAFDLLTLDKQQALFLIRARLDDKGLWSIVRSIKNVYGEGGVGIQFTACPSLESTLSRRKDFTRRFANHSDTDGGFYEKGRADAVLHFLFIEGTPRDWYVHFDLYSPVHSLRSVYKHVRYEFIGKVTPDWRVIQKCLRC